MVLMIDNYCLSQLRAIINYAIDKEVINIITSPINNLNYGIILYGKNRCKKIITQRVV